MRNHGDRAIMIAETAHGPTTTLRGGGTPDGARSPCAPHAGRTSLMLNPSQIEFLDRFCARVRRDTGGRLTKGAIIGALVKGLAESRVSLDRVRSEIHLKEALRDDSESARRLDAAGRDTGSETGRP